MLFEDILHSKILTKHDVIRLLNSEGEEKKMLFETSSEVKLSTIGNSVYLRGLIELSNICEKECYYCGIRKSNTNNQRYNLDDIEVLEAIKFAYAKGFGSIAIQSGEVQSKQFVRKITHLLQQTQDISDGNLGITLSCGEQTPETYQTWFDNGAKRYLLRIETSSRKLYKKLHPNDEKHSYSNRLNALKMLKEIGYHVGTGVMIGLPFQTTDDLADDLLFMKEYDIDMCGMGPFIEHHETPLYQYRNELKSLHERLELSLKMIAVLRLLMPDINIAATTALQTIEKNGRERAIQIGANVLMPNITPKNYREKYFLYDNKPISSRNNEDELTFLDDKLKTINHQIGYFQQGNSKHYSRKK